MDGAALLAALNTLETGTLWHTTGKCRGFADSNPGEAQKLVAYAAAVAAGQNPVAPVLATATGRGLVGLITAGVTPAPVPPVSRFPASFYTGPLGKNNVLPTGPGVFLASMFGGIGVPLGGGRAQIQSRQAAMGRRYDVLQSHYDGALAQVFQGAQGCEDPTKDNTGTTVVPPTQEAYAATNASEFMVAWTPSYTIADMNAGKADPIWKAMGSYWGNLKPQRIMLRCFHEFDLPTLAYGIRTDWNQDPSLFAVTPSQFKTAWTRMVSTIHAAGGTNVGFMWCPTEGAIGDRSVLANYYPGDDLVDWVSSDWYNPGGTGYSTPLHPGWSEFAELFHYDALGSTIASKYTQFAAGRGKPFIVGETGCVFDAAAPARKASWFKNIPAAAAKMPNLVGISFFDCNVSNYNGQPTNDYDWRVDSNAAVANTTGASDPGTLAGFGAMAVDPAFKGSA